MVFASFGVALILRNVVLLLWGPDVHYYTPQLQIAVEVLPRVRMLPDQIFVLGFTVLVVVALHLMLALHAARHGHAGHGREPGARGRLRHRDRQGDPLAWFISGALAAAAGVFLGLTVQLRPEMGFNLLLAIFTAAILGGTGSLFGAVVGGLLVGLAENLSVLVIPAGYKAAVPFLLLLLVLYFRPQGLSARRRRERDDRHLLLSGLLRQRSC